MPSPFPGMDPYLESPEIFPDFHDSYTTHLREALQATLITTDGRLARASGLRCAIEVMGG